MAERDSNGGKGSGELKDLISKAELLRSLECPVCIEIPPSSIYLCANGHNVCSSCRHKLVKCALCTGKLTETRNYAIESIISASTFKCRYDCGQIVRGDQQEDHGTRCKFRPIPCYEFGNGMKCNGALIPFNEYLYHLKETHKISGESAGNDIFCITSSAPDLEIDRRFPTFYMSFDQHVFLSNICITNKLIQWWVTMIGDHEVADQYVAKLKIYDPNNMKLQIEWTFPIHSIRKTSTEIRESALCAALPVQCMAPYLRPHSQADLKNKKQCWSTKYILERVDKKLPNIH